MKFIISVIHYSYIRSIGSSGNGNWKQKMEMVKLLYTYVYPRVKTSLNSSLQRPPLYKDYIVVRF